MTDSTGRNELDLHKSGSSSLTPRIHDLRKLLSERDPYTVASQSGTSYRATNTNHGEFCIAFFGREHKLSWPDLEEIQISNIQTSPFQLALFLFYLSTSDGTPLTGHWVTFADLPGGRMYAPAFHGYTGLEISRKFGPDGKSFELAGTQAGGKKRYAGDVSFLFKPLPLFHILAVYWIGDDDFPSACNLLFDSSAVHYLPIDVCAIAGSLVARRLINCA